MLRNLHGRNSVHPYIKAALLTLAEVHEEQGRDEALATYGQIKQTDKTSYGENSNQGV